MNLKCWIKSLSAVRRAVTLFFQRQRTCLGGRISGQIAPARLGCAKPFMSLSLSARRAFVCLGWGVLLGIPASILGQTNYYSPNGTEYAVIGSLPGDQV